MMSKFLRVVRHITLAAVLVGALVLAADLLKLPLLNLPGLITVLGGTLAASIISRSWREIRTTLKLIPAVFRPTLTGQVGDLEHLLNIAEWQRHGNLRAADHATARIKDPFLHTGIRMVLDRTPPEDIESVLQWRIHATQRHESAPIETLKAMANYAPSFGMLGTLIGLMTLLYGIDTLSAAGIGQTLGYALLSTLYGIVTANLILRPVATKMERRLAARLTHMHMMEEAVLLLQKRRHPMIIAETIAAFSPAQVPPSTNSGDMTYAGVTAQAA